MLGCVFFKSFIRTVLGPSLNFSFEQFLDQASFMAIDGKRVKEMGSGVTEEGEEDRSWFRVVQGVS